MLSRLLFLTLFVSVQAFAGRLIPLDTRTHYTVLGVTPDSTPSELRRAYVRLMQQYHPDRNPGEQMAAEQMSQRLNEAYKVLSNPSSKWEYDRHLLQSQAGGVPEVRSPSRDFQENPQLAEFTFSDALYQTPAYLRFKDAVANRIRSSFQISGSGSTRELAERFEAIYNRMGFFSGPQDEGRRALVAYDTLETALFGLGSTRQPHLFLTRLKSWMRFDPLAAEGLLLRVAFSSFSDPRFSGEAHLFAKELAPAVWLDMKANPKLWSSVLTDASTNLHGVWFQQLMIRLDEVGVNRRSGTFSRLAARTRALAKRFCERALGT